MTKKVTNAYFKDGDYYETYDDGTALKFKQNYTTDQVTNDMAYAIGQAGGNPYAWKAADAYAADMLNRVGTPSANTGKILTLEDVQKELTRLGYTTSQNGNWTQVGGQQYLTGGDDYNYLKNGYNKAGLNVNIYGGNTAKNYVPNPNMPGYVQGEGFTNQGKVMFDDGYNYMNDYNNAYAQALQKQLDQIEKNRAEEQRQAYIAMKQGQKGLEELNAASGLRDSGYAESSYIDLLNGYGSNVNNINNQYSNLYTDTAMSGAWNMEQLRQQQLENQLRERQYQDNLRQQEIENQLAMQKYQDALAQQQWENQYRQNALAMDQKQQQWENQYRNSQQQLSQLKAKADAALESGRWNQAVQDYYGLTKADVEGTSTDDGGIIDEGRQAEPVKNENQANQNKYTYDQLAKGMYTDAGYIYPMIATPDVMSDNARVENLISTARNFGYVDIDEASARAIMALAERNNMSDMQALTKFIKEQYGGV